MRSSSESLCGHYNSQIVAEALGALNGVDEDVVGGLARKGIVIARVDQHAVKTTDMKGTSVSQCRCPCAEPHTFQHKGRPLWPLIHIEGRQDEVNS